MKPQIHLDPKRLKHARERSNDLTQMQVAQALAATGKPGKTDASLLSMYQVIERTGKTSPERAESIAKVLGVPLQELVPSEPGGKFTGGAWWFEPSLRRKKKYQGLLLPSAFELIKEIQRECQKAVKPPAGVNTTMSLSLSGQKWSVTSASDNWPDLDWRCTFRPAQLTDDGGIGWKNPSDLELEFLTPALGNLIFNCANVAMLGRNRIPRKDADLGYRVDFVSGISDREPMYTKDGSRVFADELKFQKELWTQIDKHGDWRVNTGYSTVGSPPRIEVSRGSLVVDGPGDSPASIIGIVRVSMNSKGEWQAGPWPFWERDEWVKKIKARQPGIAHA